MDAKSPLVLLLVDVINHFEFPGGEKILSQARAMAPNLARLKKRARAAGVPVIYVNDNFGQWRSEASKLLSYCAQSSARGHDFVELLRPDPDDYFVLKPMHSAFYQTPLDVLLRHLGATSLILTGLATNSCILCTAHDANMRDLRIIVPSDCCAARSLREHKRAIEHIRTMNSARVLASSSLRFGSNKSKRHGRTG